MNPLVIASVVIVSVFTVNAVEPTNEQKCIEELKLDSTLLGGSEANYVKFLSDDKNKCFSKCVLEKYGIIDAAGKFFTDQIENLGPMTPEEKIKTNECVEKTANEEDLCVKYRDAFVCTIKTLQNP